jgi:hypothetical protein
MGAATIFSRLEPDTAMHHELKTWPAYFEAVRDGSKRFELRKNDRHFHSGDTLRLMEWDPRRRDYTGREIVAKIGFITDFPASLREGHVCFSLEQVIPC